MNPTGRHAATAVTPPPVKRCEACRRTNTRLEIRAVPGELGPMWLCVNPVDCRHHWLVEDQPTRT